MMVKRLILIATFALAPFYVYASEYMVANTFNIGDLNQKTLNVDISERGITVSGETSSEREEQSQNGFFKSSSFGSFMKTVPVPSDANVGRAKTETIDNKLIITLPRK